MKLAFCLFKYFPYGGLQRDFLRIAKACKTRGHEIHVYTMSWEGDIEPEFKLHLLKPTRLQNHTRSRSFAEQVKIALEAEQYDLVVGFNKMPYLDVYYAADVCYQARVREQRGFLYRLLPRYRQLVALEEAVFAKGKKTEIMLISPFQQKEFSHYYQTEPNRFHLLPPGIAKDRMAPPNAVDIRRQVRESHQIAEDQFLLLMVGSGFKTKGLDRALRGLSALPSDLKKRCHLFVIGQDNPTVFQALATQLNINDQVHFLGGRPDIPDFLLAGDLLLHPAYHENTGTVLLEAMVSGLPVLTVDICGYAHYVHEASAGVVLKSPFQQTEFNVELQKMLLSDKQEWKQNGLAFAKSADVYSLPEKAADLIESVQEKRTQQFSFDQMMALQGERFRQLEGRITQRIHLDEKTYFIKQHFGIGWKEIFKNLLQLRWPVISAKNEWEAIQTLQSLGIATPTIVAFGQRGINPAKLQSFILMEELKPVISLEDLCKTWGKNPPSFILKRVLIEKIAQISRTLHQNGINHRDFYICHFLLDISHGIENINPAQLKLYLIDLHRAQHRQVTPERWIIKDLAGLYFSSKDIGLTQRDLFRFMKKYNGKSLKQIMISEKTFWKKVQERGEQLYRDHTK